MRASTLTATLAACAVAVGMAVAPATAGTTQPLPGNEADCGARGGAYAACVTVDNQTRGFSRPGVTARTAGLAFVGTGNSVGSNSSFAWALGGGNTAPANGWVAGRCRTPRGWLNGCDVYLTTSLDTTAATANNRDLQRDIRAASSGSVSFRGWQYYKSSDFGHSCSSGNAFVRCEYINESGRRDYRRFNYRLVTETVTVRITNYIDQRLRLQHAPRWGGLVPDARGETPEGRLRNNERNSARSIAPYLDGGSLGEAFWGALRPVNEQENTLLLQYRYERGHGREGDTYTDNEVTLRVRIAQNGFPDSKGTTCTVTARSSFSRAICSIEGMSYSGNNTEVSVSVHE